jgi:hypothetical protein
MTQGLLCSDKKATVQTIKEFLTLERRQLWDLQYMCSGDGQRIWLDTHN